MKVCELRSDVGNSGKDIAVTGERKSMVVGKTSAKITIVTVVCLMIACLALVACGGSGGSSATSSAASSSASASSASASASVSSASASSSASSSGVGDFTGTWKLAAAESQGVTMGGNFGEMFGVEEGVTMTVNADGTGKLALSDQAGDFTWAENDASSIYVTPQSADGVTAQQAILATCKDGALFMPYEQGGQTADLVFTRDGNYAGAKQITLEGAVPITSEEKLYGTWKLVGMNMGGVSMTGSAEDLGALMAGGEPDITFEGGGVAQMSAGNGTWAVTADGATLTSEDITGKHTVPILAIGDEIALDYSGAFGGVDFIIAMAKMER